MLQLVSFHYWGEALTDLGVYCGPTSTTDLFTTDLFTLLVGWDLTVCVLKTGEVFLLLLLTVFTVFLVTAESELFEWLDMGPVTYFYLAVWVVHANVIL